MVADWIGMAGDGCSALNWYAEHATEMQLHPTTRIEVLRLLTLTLPACSEMSRGSRGVPETALRGAKEMTR
jgi:hypothetical protein